MKLKVKKNQLWYSGFWNTFLIVKKEDIIVFVAEIFTEYEGNLNRSKGHEMMLFTDDLPKYFDYIENLNE